MTRRLLLILIITLVGNLTISATINQTQVLKEISVAAASTKTMQCDFVQTKSLKMLGDKMISKGQMWCQNPSLLRWQYNTPYNYIFILNGNTVKIAKGKRRDTIDINKNKMFKEIARIMMNSVLGNVLTDKKDFSASVIARHRYYIVTLVPQKKEMKQMFKSILLHFDTVLKVVTKVEMIEKNGDNTVIQLNNIKVNKPINASVFKVD
ncbi:MAG: outer membrane lipoprotein carrier protein LolA [Muribaculaceae bacterium]|nr:outer membrane lipoprotein carrier protein LolA [Muribaculaceae bacterium]